MARRKRSLADDEEKYVVVNMPPIERRSLMESGMRRKTTRVDVFIVIGFLIGLLVVLTVFLIPVLTTLIHHIPDLFTSTGR
jgi:hypothetical protein